VPRTIELRRHQKINIHLASIDSSLESDGGVATIILWEKSMGVN
jgi:hypothetical protein